MASRTLAWLVLFGLLVALALRLHSCVRATPEDTLAREQATYQRVRSLILDRYIKEVDERGLFYGAMEGMVSRLDKHSRFLPPELYERLKTDTTGQFEGVGIEWNPDESLGLVVLTPLQGTPAFRGGVYPGDKILAVDGVRTEGMNREECGRRIRGPVGTKVRLTLLHEGTSRPVDVTLERSVNEIKSVPVAEMLGPDYVPPAAGSPAGEPAAKVGYVQVAHFQPKTAADMDAALARLEKEGLQALVLDLRQNPGGLLKAAEDVAELFLKDGVIVSVIARDTAGAEGPTRITYATGEKTHPFYPLAVLVDGESASASEVVAGALEDRGRAVLVGSKTYGKFSVQDVFEVPLNNWGESALKLTVARYKTPTSPCIDGQGIVPDYVVQFAPEQQRGLLQSRLARHVQDNDPRAAPGAQAPKANGGEAPAPFVDLQLRKAVEVLLQQVKAARK
ncbi:MAG: S41 family peptidase [Planctomycetota bacterium]|nr:S41 family peptidase [Planctomycetota bacterium]